MTNGHEHTLNATRTALTEDEKNAIHDATGDYDTLFTAVERIIAEHIAQARREGVADALGVAATPWLDEWLRTRAAALRGDDA